VTPSLLNNKKKKEAALSTFSLIKEHVFYAKKKNIKRRARLNEPLVI
jgi:hypothetical protein